MRKNMVKAIENFLLTKSDKIQKAPLIFIFGALSLELSRHASQLFKKKCGSYILVSGGPRRKLRGLTEAESHRRNLIKHGVPNNRIILESAAANTLENVVKSKRIILRHFKKIPSRMIIICQPFHGRRILMTLRRHLSAQTKYIMQLVPTKSHRVKNWWRNKTLRTHVIDEIRKIGEYTQRGHLTWR
ncbi:hypothetical protein A3I40_04035 [Candidatus Uhrbacteria bacterium RIFCSPLOWO2_02_FULL_48_12]|uniref:DUF218 domain-containing protein n=1 Tax=Candidatus Uhrbacteria bacterium RIFCSPLOWO2_02_FULL_48_12 TaxID=1802407 RepID=A0A1F7VA70_9BACT|nr:MAG: hypothetical protein A3I40_04035 [Candidatus Uhrbacteria bacterium RIFCSPLOWO2_02_FULL_48_12]